MRGLTLLEDLSTLHWPYSNPYRIDGGSWASAGYAAGQSITVAGAGSNNGTYTIATDGVSASTQRGSVIR